MRCPILDVLNARQLIVIRRDTRLRPNRNRWQIIANLSLASLGHEIRETVLIHVRDRPLGDGIAACDQAVGLFIVAVLRRPGAGRIFLVILAGPLLAIIAPTAWPALAPRKRHAIGHGKPGEQACN